MNLFNLSILFLAIALADVQSSRHGYGGEGHHSPGGFGSVPHATGYGDGGHHSPGGFGSVSHATGYGDGGHHSPGGFGPGIGHGRGRNGGHGGFPQGGHADLYSSYEPHGGPGKAIFVSETDPSGYTSYAVPVEKEAVFVSEPISSGYTNYGAKKISGPYTFVVESASNKILSAYPYRSDPKLG